MEETIIVRVVKSRRQRCADHVPRFEEDRSTFKILQDTPTGKRLLERLRCTSEDNIRRYLKEIEGIW